MDQVRIEIPSSSANVGLGYDIWCLGLDKPKLELTYTRIPEADVSRFGTDIVVEIRSSCMPTPGREMGYAGKLVLHEFFSHYEIKEGAHLLYEDNGYPVGGLGRSGAEAVGAVVGAAVVYNLKLSPNDVIIASGKGEPGHLDNVAASTNGRFNIISTSPATGLQSVDYFDAPENLGIAIGYSSHQKTQGTVGTRKVLKYPVDASDFVAQTGLISAATAALAFGNTDRFLELVWGDRFHEQRRADIGAYGNFTADQLNELKKQLFHDFHVALNISGAGPDMQFLYKADEHQDIEGEISLVVVPWFEERGVRLRIDRKQVARSGVYDYAQLKYNWNKD